MQVKANLSLLLIMFLFTFPQISETLFAPALPNVSDSLAVSESLAQWTLSIYFIGFALGVMVWGILADVLGRRPTMILGILIYVIACMICFMSTGIGLLFVGRLGQGLGVSVGSIVSMTLVRDLYKDHHLNRAFSMLSMALSAAPAVGALFGGYLVQYFNWRANFTFLALYGAVLLILSKLFLQETKPKTQRPHGPILPYKTIKLFFTDSWALRSLFCIGLLNGVMFSYHAEAPFIFIEILGFSASQYGQLGLLVFLGCFLGSWFSKRLCSIWDATFIVKLGCFLTFVSSLVLSFFTETHLIDPIYPQRAMILILSCMNLFFIGFGMALPNLLSGALKRHRDHLGSAGALLGFSYYMVIAVVMTVMGLIHSGNLSTMPSFFTALTMGCLLTVLTLGSQKDLNPL